MVLIFSYRFFLLPEIIYRLKMWASSALDATDRQTDTHTHTHARAHVRAGECVTEIYNSPSGPGLHFLLIGTTSLFSFAAGGIS
jgi:hypothetical protein